MNNERLFVDSVFLCYSVIGNVLFIRHCPFILHPRHLDSASSPFDKRRVLLHNSYLELERNTILYKDLVTLSCMIYVAVEET